MFHRRNCKGDQSKSTSLVKQLRMVLTFATSSVDLVYRSVAKCAKQKFKSLKQSNMKPGSLKEIVQELPAYSFIGKNTDP